MFTWIGNEIQNLASAGGDNAILGRRNSTTPEEEHMFNHVRKP